jgi:acyl-CoA reductase-like NAD-dependent aldehyde dehydrogenase
LCRFDCAAVFWQISRCRGNQIGSVIAKTVDPVKEPTGDERNHAGSVWTRDLVSPIKWYARSWAGTIGVNVHSSIDPAVPFGGFRQSGWGHEKGREVLDLYTEIKAVVMSL